MDCTKTTFSQHYEWPGLRDEIRANINVCKTYHRNKKQNLKYAKLTAKKVEAIPWDILLVAIIVPYKNYKKRSS